MFLLFVILATAGVLFTNTPARGREEEKKSGWVPDNGDGTYKNPIIFADYSDPDVVRVGDEYYLVSSSFNCVPGIPVLHSKDLVNWKIVGHVIERLPSPMFDKPQHGKGVWAPSIRYHNGEFWVFYGDPDLGIFMAKTKHPADTWEPIVLVREAKGWIDPSPFWDDDGNAYIVHGWAKSRVGFNSVLTVNKMSADGRKILDEGTTVFDGHANHPTIEGPKFYKRNSYYYIFAPAGGVKAGWQTVLRSKNVFGPYEDKIVLHQGSTTVIGPHQGGWVETQTGESWFVHFQDRGAYGRVIHLQPMVWNNDWPIVGHQTAGNEIGEPVLTWAKPEVNRKYSIETPQTSDEFESSSLGLQWQWQANPQAGWSSLLANGGALRLYSIAAPESSMNLWDVPNMLLQKFPSSNFSVTTFLRCDSIEAGEKSGLVVMGLDYSYLAIAKSSEGIRISKSVCEEADKGSEEREEGSALVVGTSFYLRVSVDTTATCKFGYSTDGKQFEQIGNQFVAREGKWIGAKVGLFSLAAHRSTHNGFVDIEWFRVE